MYQLALQLHTYFFLSIGNGRINLLPTYAYDFEVDVEF